MIHTFTITHQINAAEYGAFLAAEHTKIYEAKKYIPKNCMLEEMGIILYAYKYKVPERPDYFCYNMFVNPCKVLGRDDVTQIYTAELFQEFQAQFNDIISRFELPLPELQYWKAHRVDYTKNIVVPNVELYIKLFQKANLSNYKFKKNEQNNILRYRPGSLHCRRGNHMINFYNKYDEILNNNPYYGEEELEQAKNILRIEVQCKRQKLDSIKKNYNLPDKNIIYFLQNESISNEILKYYVKKILGTAPYYKKSTAERLVKKSNYRKQTKELMLQLIDDVSKQYSAIDKVKSNYQDITQLLKKFEDIGVNPVTINKNEKGVSVCLPAIYSLL